MYLEIDAIISYIITIISVVLFFLERKKNNRLPVYMTIQGLMRNLQQKSQFYAHLSSSIDKRIEKGETTITTNEYKLLVSQAYSESQALIQITMGQLKALEPLNDLPFNANEFLENKISKIE